MKYLDICKVTGGFYEGQNVRLLDFLEEDNKYLVMVPISKQIIANGFKQAAVKEEDLKVLSEEEIKELMKLEEKELSKPKIQTAN